MRLLHSRATSLSFRLAQADHARPPAIAHWCRSTCASLSRLIRPTLSRMFTIATAARSSLINRCLPFEFSDACEIDAVLRQVSDPLRLVPLEFHIGHRQNVATIRAFATPHPDTLPGKSYLPVNTRGKEDPAMLNPTSPLPAEGPHPVPPGQLHRRQMGAGRQRPDHRGEEPRHRRGDRRGARAGRRRDPPRDRGRPPRARPPGAPCWRRNAPPSCASCTT